MKIFMAFIKRVFILKINQNIFTRWKIRNRYDLDFDSRKRSRISSNKTRNPVALSMRSQRTRLLTSELLITGLKILQAELASLQGEIKTSKSLREAILFARRSMTGGPIVFAQRIKRRKKKALEFIAQRRRNLYVISREKMFVL